MDDLISRQAAIDALEDAGMTNYQATGDFYGIINALTVIKNLPTAEPRKGKWIAERLMTTSAYNTYQVLRCSICGHSEVWQMGRNYCPNCGARMEEESDEADKREE